ncbi:hypothetical protein FQR65_LT14236 [Abscondita terminalis]|nr:hypothetical protein FQR65_LT14236 [Abscondita terminalis]
MSITEDPIGWKSGIQNEDELRIDLVKKEIKEELEEEVSILFNTDIHLAIDDCIPVSILYCHQCHYGTNNKHNLTDHVFTHRFKCDRCNYTTPDASTLMTHKQIHSVTVSFNCNIAEADTSNSHVRTCLNTTSEEQLDEVKIVKPKGKCNLCGFITNNDNSEVIAHVCGQLVENVIKAEDVVKEESISFNTEIPLCVEEDVSVIDDESDVRTRLNGQDVENTFDQQLNQINCDRNISKKFKLPTHVRTLAENAIEIEDISVFFNTDIPLCVEEENVPVALCCYHCNYETNDKLVLIDHIFIHRFECERCKYTTPDKSLFLIHQNIHVPSRNDDQPKIFNCETCTFSTVTLRKLSKHKYFNHGKGKGKYKCKLCNYACSHKPSLRAHEATHTGKKLFKCDLCDFSCNFVNSLRNHRKTHSNERPFHCNKCDRKFLRKSHFIEHERTHSNEKPIKCKLCDYCCKQYRSLREHMKQHSVEKRLNCDKCNYKTFSKYSLSEHIKTHSDEKPFKCHLCDYCSKRKHIKVHSKEKPFKCDMCDFSTKRSDYLTKHLKKHSGGTNFTCDKCDYKTFFKSTLTKHKKIHSEEKPKRNVRKGSLKRSVK